MADISSDYDSSLATESEAEIDYWNEEPTKTDSSEPNWSAEVENIIRTNVDVTTPNAIALNNHYQTMLRHLRTHLETLLNQCQERLKLVDTMVDQLQLIRKESHHHARIPGYICGQPFFKDYELYPGPHNADYLYRKNVKKEFFPLDMFEATETHWTTKDKKNLKQGIFEQALHFLRGEVALRIKMCSDTPKAEQLKLEMMSFNSLTLYGLWSKVQSYDGKFGGHTFLVDWLRISNINVSGRHTPAACEGMWNQYLKPGLKKGSWTEEEESSLIAVARDMNHQDWERIAQMLEHRSPYQCFVHFRSNFSPQAQIQRTPWTPEEDELLLRLVQENRIGSNVVWNKVVEKMPFRSKVQAYQRYKYTLARSIKGAKFTAEDDCTITAYVQQYGEDFKYFPERLLQGRTVKQIRARYCNTLKYVNKHTGWSLEEDRRLMSYIAEHLTDEGPEKISWSDCSKHLVNHSRGSCRSRYYTIEKFLEKNPNATLEAVPRRERKKLSTDVSNENWINTIVAIKSTSDKVSTSSYKDRIGLRFKTPDELDLYDQMKFSFRYQFGYKLSTEKCQRHVHTGVNFLLHLMEGFSNANLNSETQLSLNDVDHSTMLAIMQAELNWSYIVGALRPKKTRDGEIMLFCRFPPNYNTILGLRAVCLNAHYDSTKLRATCKAAKNARTPKTLHYDRAITLFLDRFRKIFYWSMLLAMLNIDDVNFETHEESLVKTIIELCHEKDLESTSGEPSVKTRSNVQNDLLASKQIDHLKQNTNANLVQLQSSAVTYSSAADTMGINYTNSNLDLTNSITIIDPKDLPCAPGKLVHWQESNIPGTTAGQHINIQFRNHGGRQVSIPSGHVDRVLTAPELNLAQFDAQQQFANEIGKNESTMENITLSNQNAPITDQSRKSTIVCHTSAQASHLTNLFEKPLNETPLLQNNSGIDTAQDGGQEHGVEIFIIREIDTATQRATLREIVIPNRRGDHQSIDRLIVEENDYESDEEYNERRQVHQTSERIFPILGENSVQQHSFWDRNDALTAFGNIRETCNINETMDCQRLAAEKFTIDPSCNAEREIGIALRAETSKQSLPIQRLEHQALTEVNHAQSTDVSVNFKNLLGTMDGSCTAVDIFRILSAQKQTVDSGTNVDSEVEELL